MTASRSPARAASVFRVDVRRLRRAVGTRSERHVTEAVEGLAVTGSAVPDVEPVEADVVLEAVFGGVSVTGTVRAPWSGSCRRCLGPASGTLAVAVRELFTPGGDGDETYPLDDDVVDLEPLVRDAVLLELPTAPLCRPDCRGLCPACGADRNVAPCSCEPPRDERWAALDVLRRASGGEGDEGDAASTGGAEAASTGGSGGAGG